MTRSHEGGCHCGALRYRIAETPVEAGYCHCRICQRTTGAPVLAWASVPAGSFAMTKGAPVVYRSSSWGERHFCGACGAQVLYRDSDPQAAVEINLGTLDEPAAVTPDHHIFTSSRIAWFDTADDLPRHEEDDPKN